MIEIVLDGILASLLRLSLSVLLSSRNNSGKEMELIIQYCCIISQTILLRILSSLQIAFCSVVKEMDCMDMNCYDAFHLDSCFISHGALAFPSSSSFLLITVLIYLLPSNPHSIHLSLQSLLLIVVSSCHSSFL